MNIFDYLQLEKLYRPLICTFWGGITHLLTALFSAGSTNVSGNGSDPGNTGISLIIKQSELAK